jgi:hypothetical protein
MRDALSVAGGAPVLVQDATTQKSYFLVESSSASALFEQWLAREFDVGLESVDAGRVGPLDMEQIKARGRELLEQERRNA